ncbi:MAG: glycosyltransferase family 2 protein, partial [Calditrichaeota bacterium]|nr:glycosyltransferase family 2 protein [Calditrichota bacterium]
MRINIYSPTYFRFNKTQKAISTIIETVNSSKHDVKLYLCDNNSPHEMKLWLLDQDVHNERVVTYLSPINYGKASIVNTVHGAARQSDYIASIDSDMLNTHDEYNWIDEMI